MWMDGGYIITRTNQPHTYNWFCAVYCGAVVVAVFGLLFGR